MNSVRLKFMGAIGTVTGSCTLIEYNKTHYYLVDAGMYQGESSSELEEIREKILKKYVKKIEIIFLTHAHLDHIGLLPDLIEWGFDGIIFGTKVTVELTKIMLEDLIKITKNHSLKIIEKMKFYAFDENRGYDYFRAFGKKYYPLSDNLRVTILRTAHILGACSYLFQYTEEECGDLKNIESIQLKNLYFTGDIGSVSDDVRPNILFKEHQIPFNNEYKTIVMESTYGGRRRPKKTYIEKYEKLSEEIQKAMENGKTVIIPAFALDRAQQILVDLQYISSFNYKKKLLDLYNAIAEYKSNNKDSCITDVFDYIPTEKFGKEIQKKISKEVKLLLNELNHVFNEFPADLQNKIESINKKSKMDIGIKSPLIRKINKIYCEHLDEEFLSETKEKRSYKYLSDIFLQEFGIEGEVSPEQKKSIRNRIAGCLNKNAETGNIIVSASGMCDEGPILDLLKKYLPDENSIIILTGYMANNTNGYLLKNYINKKFNENNLDEKISLNNIGIRMADIKCEIIDMSEYYSGHADKEQLVNYVTNSRYNEKLIKTTIFLNHGQNNAREELKEAIEKIGNNKIEVLLPKINKWYDIITGEEDDTDEIESAGIDNAYISKHCRSINIDGIEMYVPMEYNEEKLKNIIEFIKNN